MQLNFWVSDLFIQYRPIMQSGNCTQRIIFIVTRLVRFGDAGTAAQQGARAIARDLLGKMSAPLDQPALPFDDTWIQEIKVCVFQPFFNPLCLFMSLTKYNSASML
jgi:hypothetical protein